MPAPTPARAHQYRNTPGLLNLVGLGALGAAAALVLLVPGEPWAGR